MLVRFVVSVSLVGLLVGCGSSKSSDDGCDPETCVDGTGCYCDGPLNSKASKCVCPTP